MVNILCIVYSRKTEVSQLNSYSHMLPCCNLRLLASIFTHRILISMVFAYCNAPVNNVHMLHAQVVMTHITSFCHSELSLQVGQVQCYITYINNISLYLLTHISTLELTSSPTVDVTCICSVWL